MGTLSLSLSQRIYSFTTGLFVTDQFICYIRFSNLDSHMYFARHMHMMCVWLGDLQGHTRTSRSYGGRSNRTWWGSCWGWGAGSTVSSRPLFASLIPLAPTRLAVWATRLSRWRTSSKLFQFLFVCYLWSHITGFLKISGLITDSALICFIIYMDLQLSTKSKSW